MINCDSGDAYQGMATRPILKLLYFHPVGLSLLSGACEYAIVGPFSAVAIVWHNNRVDVFCVD